MNALGQSVAYQFPIWAVRTVGRLVEPFKDFDYLIVVKVCVYVCVCHGSIGKQHFNTKNNSLNEILCKFFLLIISDVYANSVRDYTKCRV